MTTVISGSYPAINSDSDATVNGLTVGKGGGAVSTNTAVGVNAIASNTSGANNTVVGSGAMADNTSGSLNTAMGRLALNANTTGANNTGLGYQALALNTTASNNTAVGYQAGYANTTGIQNNFFGSTAGVGNTTGQDNNFFGNFAGRGNTTANYNTAIGTLALGSTSNNGSHNIGIGYYALSTNTGGSNTAIGSLALQANTTANYMTAVGYQAGYSHTGGEWFGTFLGYRAGYTSTGAGNTFIGSDAGYLVSTGAKNTVIGRYNGNQNGLDIRTASNYIVLSDGDGNPRYYIASSGNFFQTGSVNGDVLGTFTNTNASSPYGLTMSFNSAAPNNANNFFYGAFDNAATRFVAMSNGGIKNYSANNVNLSDQSVKKDIQLAGNYLDKICAIPVKTFLYVDQTDTDLNLGVIAQDVQAVAPELTTEVDWGTKDEPNIKLSVYESDLMFALMKSIQELNAKVEAQAAEIAALKGANNG